MENKYIIIIVVVIIAVMFVAGGFVGDQQTEVAGCTAKWRTVPTTVQQSELCNQSQCTAQPSEQQHNAIVDAVLCACAKAKSGNYADDATNKRIEEILSLSFNYQTTAKNVCDQPGLILVKHSYE